MADTPARATSGNQPTLTQATYGFVLLTLLIVSTIMAAVFWSRSERLIDDALDLAVRTRTNAAGQVFARTLHKEWSDLRFLASTLKTDSGADLRDMMSVLRSDGNRVSWVGYADTAGTVLEASDGLLVGADVSARPWFRNGLKSGFAGDVHEAVLLAQKLRPEGGDPLRFVDFALPVKTPEGDLTGVLGMHIDLAWVERTLEETGKMLGIDLFLINQAGEVIMAPTGKLPGSDELQFLRAARAGTQTAGREVWPDGHAYFTTLVPSVTYGDLPSFGWRLAGRIDASSFNPGLSALKVTALIAGVAGLVVFALLTALFVQLFLRPISGLASFAERLAKGGEDYPPEALSSREAAELSKALSRIQAERSVRTVK